MKAFVFVLTVLCLTSVMKNTIVEVTDKSLKQELGL